MGFTRQCIIVWTFETKSLLPPFAGFSKEGPFDKVHGHALVERLEEISGRICLLNYGLLGI